jgi:hypothetical protein
VVQLHHEKDAIHGRGAELIVVGNGNRHFAQAFAEDVGLTTPLYVDTKRDAYRALQMKRSLGSVVNTQILGNMARALKSGFRQKGVQGDAWQLGGVLVVTKKGEIAYRYLSDAAGDHPPVREVIAAIPQR